MADSSTPLKEEPKHELWEEILCKWLAAQGKPIEIGDLSSLTELNLGGNQLTSIPETIGNLSSLTELDLSWNQLTSIPETIGHLSSLTKLDLSWNQLTSIPETIGNLSSLTGLSLSGNQLTSIPETIGNLSSLTMLDLSGNQLTSIPETIGNLSSLTMLYLSGNQLTSIPETIGNLSSLTELYLGNNQLEKLPADLFNRLERLTFADLSSNRLKEVPRDWIVALSDMKRHYGPLKLELADNQFPIVVQAIVNEACGDHPSQAGRRLSTVLKHKLQSPLLMSRAMVIGDSASGKTTRSQAFVQWCADLGLEKNTLFWKFSRRVFDEQKHNSTVGHVLYRARVGLPTLQKEIADTSCSVLPAMLSSESLSSREFCMLLLDFGGQVELYATHRIFLTSRASVYFLLVDLREKNGTIQAQAARWLTLVHSRIPRSSNERLPVVLVATHADQAEDKRVLKKAMGERWVDDLQKYFTSSVDIKGHFVLGNNDIYEAKTMELHKQLFLQLWNRTKGDTVPLAYLRCLEVVQSLCSGDREGYIPILRWGTLRDKIEAEAKNHTNDAPWAELLQRDEEGKLANIQLAIHVWHTMGELVFFDDEATDDTVVVLETDWSSTVMARFTFTPDADITDGVDGTVQARNGRASFRSHKAEYQGAEHEKVVHMDEDGVFKQKDFQELWNGDDELCGRKLLKSEMKYEDVEDCVMQMLESYDLCYRVPHSERKEYRFPSRCCRKEPRDRLVNETRFGIRLKLIPPSSDDSEAAYDPEAPYVLPRAFFYEVCIHILRELDSKAEVFQDSIWFEISGCSSDKKFIVRWMPETCSIDVEVRGFKQAEVSAARNRRNQNLIRTGLDSVEALVKYTREHSYPGLGQVRVQGLKLHPDNTKDDERGKAIPDVENCELIFEELNLFTRDEGFEVVSDNILNMLTQISSHQEIQTGNQKNQHMEQMKQRDLHHQEQMHQRDLHHQEALHQDHKFHIEHMEKLEEVEEQDKGQEQATGTGQLLVCIDVFTGDEPAHNTSSLHGRQLMGLQTVAIWRHKHLQLQFKVIAPEKELLSKTFIEVFQMTLFKPTPKQSSTVSGSSDQDFFTVLRYDECDFEAELQQESTTQLMDSTTGEAMNIWKATLDIDKPLSQVCTNCFGKKVGKRDNQRVLMCFRVMRKSDDGSKTYLWEGGLLFEVDEKGDTNICRSARLIKQKIAQKWDKLRHRHPIAALLMQRSAQIVLTSLGPVGSIFASMIGKSSDEITLTDLENWEKLASSKDGGSKVYGSLTRVVFPL